MRTRAGPVPLLAVVAVIVAAAVPWVLLSHNRSLRLHLRTVPPRALAFLGVELTPAGPFSVAIFATPESGANLARSRFGAAVREVVFAHCDAPPVHEDCLVVSLDPSRLSWPGAKPLGDEKRRSTPGVKYAVALLDPISGRVLTVRRSTPRSK